MRWLVHPKQSVRKLKPGDADSDSLIPASRIAFPSSAQEMREQDFDAAIKGRRAAQLAAERLGMARPVGDARQSPRRLGIRRGRSPVGSSV